MGKYVSVINVDVEGLNGCTGGKYAPGTSLTRIGVLPCLPPTSMAAAATCKEGRERMCKDGQIDSQGGF